MAKHEIHGKTKGDVEQKFTEWQRDKAGLVRNVKCHEIKPIIAKPSPRGIDNHRSKDLPDLFSMMIEYDCT